MNKVSTENSIYYLTDDELQRFHLHSTEEILSVEKETKKENVNWIQEGFWERPAIKCLLFIAAYTNKQTYVSWLSRVGIIKKLTLARSLVVVDAPLQRKPSSPKRTRIFASVPKLAVNTNFGLTIFLDRQSKLLLTTMRSYRSMPGSVLWTQKVRSIY